MPESASEYYGGAFDRLRDPAWSEALDALGPVRPLNPYPFSPLPSAAISPDELLAAVRGMNDTQRSEMAGLLGLPTPRHPFLWLPSRDGFAAPLVEFGQ